ncbi:MAG: peptidoglycan DD-metalloendopeptidase family protein [Acidobacteriia bacterium]|nr:peptidoglycan DD-metalloendopeptidase family protein [Terriglobia bacterium]MYK11188.1 peptidoglycan DD-metalloendopeptidase family protein [Terriglobia bacterium]
MGAAELSAGTVRPNLAEFADTVRNNGAGWNLPSAMADWGPLILRRLRTVWERCWPILRWCLPGTLALVLISGWAAYFSGGMAAVVGWLALVTAGQTLAPVSLMALLAHALRTRHFSRPMQVTFGLAAVAFWPALWGFGILTITFPFSLGTSSPSATVRLPSNEELLVGWGGDSLDTNYHAAYPDQRWAYDLLVEPAAHGGRDLADYGCYGTPVVAPAAATVAMAVDGLPDHMPGKASMDIKHPAGNSVALELHTGTYLLIAHLQRGSVLVERGDQVEEGQPIGACGNSGNTSEPHIHIHHQRQNPRGRPLNFSEGLPLYFRDHDGPPMPEGGLEVRDQKIVLTGATVRHAADTPAEIRAPLQ